MAEIANSNKLELKLTQYGLTRITEAMKDPTLNLAITKIRIGSGRDNQYYSFEEQNPDVSQLEGDLRYTFYVYEKQLLEDGLTISFRTTIPEDIGGFDIREVGLYETVDNEDRLFAICTQQPFVKPSPEYNYFINVNYYIFLKIQNAADIYDRITLDVEHSQVSEADLESLMRSFLFAQSNLMNQIGKNSKLIGLNRASQIMEKVNENKTSFNYITLYKNFASTLDLVKDYSNIFSYWVFDYSRRTSSTDAIVNLANTNNITYLSTNAPVTSFEHKYNGFQSMFKFEGSDCYFLSSDDLNFYDSQKVKDKSFTMAFSLEPIQKYYEETRTIIAKVNRAQNSAVFKVQELADGVLQVTLYQDLSNYITFTTSKRAVPKEAHSIVLVYDGSESQMRAYINSKSYQMLREEEGNYRHMDPSPSGTLYEFKATPVYSIGTYDNNTGFCKPDGTSISSEDAASQGWTIDNGVVKYGTEVVEPSGTPHEEKLYAWAYTKTDIGELPSEFIYLRESDVIINEDTNIPYPNSENVPFYNEDFELVSRDQTDFTIVQNQEGDWVVTYKETVSGWTTEYYASKNVEREVTSYTYTAPEVAIYAPATTFTSADYSLYEDNGGKFVRYNGGNWAFKPIGSGQEYKIYYKREFEAVLTKDGNEQPVPINAGSPMLASYIVAENGNNIEPINSSVGLISIIMEELSDVECRTLALNLCATLGKNPFLNED